MQRWLVRFSFSFIIVGLLLLWETYKITRPGVEAAPWRVSIYLIGAAASFAVGAAGVRARHRGDH
jgi:hypothetical protein